MKLSGSTKNLKDKTKNAENAESWSNQYQQKCEVLNTFKPNKSYAYLLNIEPSNSVFDEFDELIIAFIDQNGRPIEIGEKVNLALLINK